MKVQVLLGMAIIEGECEVYDFCKFYFREVLSLSFRFENVDLIMVVYYWLGQLYYGLKEYDFVVVYIIEVIFRLDEFGIQCYVLSFFL